MTHNIIKAKKHLEKAREIISKRKSPLANMREVDVIEKIRKDREAIWEEKLAARP